MQFDVVTLFPDMFTAITQSGITRRAFEQKKCALSLWNPRDFTTDNYRTIDDRPYGGGPGMVMMAKPLEAAIGAAKSRQMEQGLPQPRVVYLSPQGKHLGTINTGEATANCAFGDRDGSMLYITADMYLCRVRTRTKGMGW